MPAPLLCLMILLAKDVSDLEKLAVDGRRAIPSGQIIVRSHYRRQNLAHDWVHHIWWDGDSFRQDESLADSAHPDDRNVFVWTNGKFLHWNSLVADGRKTVGSYANANNAGVVGSKKRLDPRRIGFIPSDFSNLSNYALDEIIANPARSKTEIAKEDLQGTSCDVISIWLSNGARFKVWIAPSKGHSILRMEGDSMDGSVALKDIVEVEVEQQKTSGLWFPKRSHYQRLADGKLQEEDDATVEVISLNEPISPEVFTFAGVGVPPGWPMRDRTRPDIPDELVFDGKNIVSVSQGARVIAGAWRLKVAYAAGSLLLAVVAVILIWRFISARESTS